MLLKYHLLFLTKLHYKKMRIIEKMFEKYFKLKEEYGKTENEYIITNYVKSIISYLKECKEIEILGDDFSAFGKRFHCISQFMEELFYHNSYYPYMEEGASDKVKKILVHDERLRKKISKAGFLLNKKIIDHLK